VEPIRILTLNIHKGFSPFARKLVLHNLREAIRASKADLVFLQEVSGRSELEQAEYLADEVWSDFAYARNAVFDDRHHGNAILSRYAIGAHFNTDISSSRFEKRGFLYASIQTPTGNLHAICLHLSLRSSDRKIQATALRRFVESLPKEEGLIIAGDFNDWSYRMREWVEAPLKLQEAFRFFHGKEAKTFPSYFPILSLDRVYTRGFSIKAAERFNHAEWPQLSDHLGLIVELSGC